MELLTNFKINNPYSYNDYRDMVVLWGKNKQCSGEATPEHIEATIINAQRIKRIDKQCVINDELSAVIKSISKPYTWLLLTESWCGDGAQCIPVIAKMAELNPLINLQLIFRDENLSIMDEFLNSAGSRAIPKLLFIHNKEVIGNWGARPKAIQQMVKDFKQANPNATHDEFVVNLHLWYARDKTEAIQNEFNEILKQY